MLSLCGGVFISFRIVFWKEIIERVIEFEYYELGIDLGS